MFANLPKLPIDFIILQKFHSSSRLSKKVDFESQAYRRKKNHQQDVLLWCWSIQLTQFLHLSWMEQHHFLSSHVSWMDFVHNMSTNIPSQGINQISASVIAGETGSTGSLGTGPKGVVDTGPPWPAALGLKTVLTISRKFRCSVLDDCKDKRWQWYLISW